MPFLSLLPNGDKRYRIQDNLGSTRVVLSADGSLYDWNEYEPFGTILRSGGGQLSSDRLSYIGKEKDSESDLGDFGVRKYEAETGRFLSVDPLWEEQRPWNVYHYSANNPIVAKDPDGKIPTFVIGAIIGATVEIGSQLIEHGTIDSPQKVFVSTLAGAATGGLSALGTRVVRGGAISVAEGYAHAKIKGKTYNADNAVNDAITGAVSGG